MKTSAYLLLDFRRFFLRRRWLLPVFTGLILGYGASDAIKMLSGLPSAATGVEYAGIRQGNALEAFLWAFGKPEIVYFVATVLFIYLISDLLPDDLFGRMALFRLQSRRQGWIAKTALVLFFTLVYCLLLFGAFFLVAGAQLPFSGDWSQVGLDNFGMNLGFSLKNGSLLHGSLVIALLLFLGWFAAVMLALTINQISQKYWPGFLSGALFAVLANLGSIFGGAINQKGLIAYFLLYNHLEYTPLWSPQREMPLVVSIIFWLIWILTCFVAGMFASRRQNFYLIQ